MSRPFIYILLCFLNADLSAQMQHLCGSEIFDSIMLSTDIDHSKKIENFELKYQDAFSNGLYQRKGISVSLTLPVVFHIIHNDGPEQLPDEVILKGLENLNQAFANEGFFFNTKGVNTDIQFCLAARDENGKFFSGIKRYKTPFTDMSISGGFEWLRDSAIIDHRKYINIQIVKNACMGSNCNVAGFSGTHRLVVESSALLTTTFIHEMGHYLGLKHTFRGGCKNDNCLKDGDLVCDTPPDNRTFDGCNELFNSCNTDSDDPNPVNPFRLISLGGSGNQPDDNINYMDYNFTECRKNFTQGQSDRMRFVIEELYASLLQSEVCKPPCDNEVSALFNLPDTIIAGTVFNIINHSSNATDFEWYIDRVAAGTTKDLNYSFINVGIVNVKLVALSGNDNCRSDSITKKIYVICPLDACFNYSIRNQYLIFEECSHSGNLVHWEIMNDTKLIFSSSNTIDSFYIKHYPFLKLCLKVDNGICTKQYCQYINTTGTNDEICNNGQDDDGDGLIDEFDLDCPCSGANYYSHCKPECEVIPDFFPEIKMKLKWQSEALAKGFNLPSSYVVGNLSGDDNPEIITFFGTGTTNNIKNYIAVLDGATGLIIDTIQIFPEFKQWNLLFHPAILLNKEDSKKYIYTTSLGEIICVDNKNNLVFRRALPLGIMNDIVGIADFNYDGIPEVYCGASILNSMTGEVLFYDGNSISENNYSQVISIASDVLGNDGIPELITGKYVFKVELNNLDGIIGNNFIAIQAPPSVENGRCAVADLDGDGQKEIIVLESNNVNLGKIGKLSIWDPVNGNLLAQVQNPIFPDNFFDGSIPFIGDIDGDCLPEIGVVYNKILKMYKYNVSDGLTEMYSIKISDRSGQTGVTMFDFNQDGRQELIYRDENYLRIIDGESGQTLDSVELLSSTWLEYPIIVDIDKDGQAEILVSGSISNKEEPQLFCFESATMPWAPARSVWNQYAYNPTFVNDDLTIPRYQQNTAQPLQHTDQCSREVCDTPYNNFMAQATYRTQEGCYVWPQLSTDLSITASSRCMGDSLEICFYPGANQDGLISGGVTISCYFPGDDDQSLLIETMTINLDTVCVMMPVTTGLDSMLIVINNNGSSFPFSFSDALITECDYTNNSYMLDLRPPDLSIDVIDYRCDGDSLTFTIVIENVGSALSDSCIDGGCYFVHPLNGEPIEITSWCLNLTPDSITYKSIDTIAVTIPMPVGVTEMYWTVNDKGFGPGILSSEISRIFECNYSNNIDLITFDLSVRDLSIGGDTAICQGAVVTIDPGEWSAYEWSDLTTDRINSFTLPGEYWIKTTDQCKRIYTDTFTISEKQLDKIDLGPDIQLCPGLIESITVSVPYDSIKWSPETRVNCNTCFEVELVPGADFELMLEAYKEGCVTRDTIAVEYKRLVEETQKIILCENEKFTYRDSTWYEAGIYHYAVGQCDSLITFDIEKMPTPVSMTSMYICEGDSVLIGGEWRNSSGTYADVLKTVMGCDSLAVTDLSILPSISTMESIEICSGKTIMIHGIMRSQEGTYTGHYQTYLGCDSVSTVVLTVTPPIFTQDSIWICENETASIHGQIRNSQGVYIETYQTTQGCDSTSAVYLTISPYKVTNRFYTLCEGDSLWLLDRFVKASGIYTDTLSTSIDCDEIIRYKVDILPISQTEIMSYLCPSKSIEINGRQINAPGVYIFDGFSNISGCDSIVIVNIISIPSPEEPSVSVNCEDNSITIIAVPDNVWTYAKSDGQNFDTLQVKNVRELKVTARSIHSCDSTFTLFLPDIPESGDIPAIADQNIASSAGLTITVPVDENEWRIRWFPTSLVSCDSCLTTTIITDRDTTMTVIMIHSSGCVYERSFRVEVENSGNIVFPNIFNPSGSSNPIWRINMPQGFVIQDLFIYDRWGNVMAGFNNTSTIAWDGTHKGSPVSSGVYVYVVKYIDLFGRVHFLRGDVTVFR